MMLLFLAAAAVSATPQKAPAPAAVVQATATVRIISAVRIKFDSPNDRETPPPHDSKVTADGKIQPARLIEFE